MTLEELRELIQTIAEDLDQGQEGEMEEYIRTQPGVFPFNEWEYRLMYLRDKGLITFDRYESIRTDYVNANQYLKLFGLAPRIFGEIWGQQHIREIDSRFEQASKNVDPTFDGEYDLLIEGVKVEIKAARAIDTKKRGDLVSKALRSDSNRPFWMNFQQLKPDLCDIFIFIGVWVDQIKYWLILPEQAKANRYFSRQHRGGIEYQIGIKHNNRTEFDQFLTEPNMIGDRIIELVKRPSNTHTLN